MGDLLQSVMFRSILSTLTALSVTLLGGRPFINWLQSYRASQAIRTYLPGGHSQKIGTPTMGGMLILVAVTISLLLWGDWQNRFVWVVWLVMIGCGLIGFIDDAMKLIGKNTTGLPGRWKLVGLSCISGAGLAYLYSQAASPLETQLIIPFATAWAFELGLFYIIWGVFVVVGSSNAVNLTDGLDGLAVLPVVLIIAGLSVFAYVSGHAAFSDYLSIPSIPGVGELCILTGAIAGAGLGFLWFNAYPAELFMGDVGSLSLGAALGMVAFVIRQEFILVLMGGVFVMETLSVIIQVSSVKWLGRRFFKLAPLHHHFELKGWHETKVVVRFWVLTLIFVLIGLMTLKWH